jgi:predicted pyridoxine 5'-phosphate oxidase superfamily flavin-nucleotide-binding protein
MSHNNSQSPFHRGERAIQSQLGVRERMEKFGQRVIRDYMPDQHRDFYTKLPYIIVGHADTYGNPWASILFKEQELINSPNENHLTINTSPVTGDPLATSLKDNVKEGINTKLGLLGIELETRRRNRLSAHVTDYTEEKIHLKIVQAFGNCPKYIQSRNMTFTEETKKKFIASSMSELDQQARQLIEKSDTFFIASFLEGDSKNANKGADVSHRGGKPGFIGIKKNTLTIPDYQGNNHFNTLGNILENPVAGLLFIDFESGDILMLSGKAQIIWDTDELDQFEGAQRLLKFTLTKGVSIKQAVPIKWGAAELSRFL